MVQKIQAKILSDYLDRELNNGHYRLTFNQIARGLWPHLKVPHKEHIQAIRDAWQSAQKQLRRRKTCAILVTEFYFDVFRNREPSGKEQIKMCLALYHKAHGVRLLTMKGAVNDPMAIEYFSVRGRNVHGMMSAIADRATVEHDRGKLTKIKAKAIVDKLAEIPLPEHQKEFFDLMS